jgi:hypothetical protein
LAAALQEQNQFVKSGRIYEEALKGYRRLVVSERPGSGDGLLVELEESKGRIFADLRDANVSIAELLKQTKNLAAEAWYCTEINSLLRRKRMHLV